MYQLKDKTIMTKKTTKAKTATVATTVLSNEDFLGKIRRLAVGKTVAHEKFGVVKCTRAAKDSKTGKRMFSVSKSTVAANRGGYTLDTICTAFGLKK